MNKTIPAISIVIPMYNAEKFIADAIESILAQTFQDFEVIIVDDCSTDNSCAIVESYIPKFGGKLKLFKSEKNSGTPSIPRNTGIRLSRGEYICFLDSDDGLLPTALEEINYLTTKFKADVIHCEKYYTTAKEEFTTDKNFLQLMTWEVPPYVNSPTFLSNDLAQRMDAFLKTKICPFTWCKIIRRDFLLQNNIIFPPMRVSGDYPYTFHIVCKAKTFLRVPNRFHVYRNRENSQSRSKFPKIEEWVHTHLYSIFYGLAYFNKLMDSMDFFAQNPKVRYDVLDIYIQRQVKKIVSNYKRFPLGELQNFMQMELNNIEVATELRLTELLPFFFSRMTFLNMEIYKYNTFLEQFKKDISGKNLEIQKQLETVQNQAAKIKNLERQLETLKKG